MFTKNWYKVFTAVMGGESSDLTYTSITGAVVQVDKSISSLLLCDNTNSYTVPSLYNVRTQYGAYGGVILGTGATPPTIDDIALSGELISTISCVSTVTVTHDEDGVTIESRHNVNNTGASEITVGEIGLIANLYSSNNSSAQKALLERTVLESPITIESGGVGQVTYTIRFNYPTA